MELPMGPFPKSGLVPQQGIVLYLRLAKLSHSSADPSHLSEAPPLFLAPC